MDEPAARSKVGSAASGDALVLPAQAPATRASPPAAAAARRPALVPVVRPLTSGRLMPRVLACTENLRSSIEYLSSSPKVPVGVRFSSLGTAPYNRIVMCEAARPPGEGRRAGPARGVSTAFDHAVTARCRARGLPPAA